MTVLKRTGSFMHRVKRLLTRGRAHRRRLAQIDVRVSVMGTRGKSSLVTWLHEAFVAREYDTYAKVTGEQPHSLYNGERYPIKRDGPTKLYESEREIRKFDPEDVIIIENQGIREYTTRLVNEDYVDPSIVVLTNARRDHLDTLGTNAFEIARALARAVPRGSQVVTAERNSVIAEYLDEELARRDSTLTRVIRSGEGPVSPGDELVNLLDGVLEVAGVEELTDRERAAFHQRMAIDWVRLPAGDIYNAANVNDVESTEIVRRVLQGDQSGMFQPLVYFRADRPGRTRSFIRYFNWLSRHGLIDSVHGLGAHEPVVKRRIEGPVVWHDETLETSGQVLDEVLSGERPVIVMGNTVPEFMQDLAEEIRARAESPISRESKVLSPQHD